MTNNEAYNREVRRQERVRVATENAKIMQTYVDELQSKYNELASEIIETNSDFRAVNERNKAWKELNHAKMGLRDAINAIGSAHVLPEELDDVISHMSI